VIISVGDVVEVKRGLNPLLRDAKIKNISISSTGRQGHDEYNVAQYDTNLDYVGSITYEDVTFNQNGDMHWAYFNQIRQKVNA